MGQSKCVEKIGSIQVFQKPDGTYDAYDFATGEYIADPYKDKPEGYVPVKLTKSPEQIAEEIREIAEDYKTVALPERKLSKESLEYFGVKIGVSERDGITPVTHYYPYYGKDGLSGYKVRLIENKRMWAIGSTKNTKLFGWDQAVAAGSKRLFITEGELDAVALYQIFRDANRGGVYADLLPSVVSLQNGAGGAVKSLSTAAEAIRKTFSEIVLVFDMDEPGRKAVEEVLKILPEALVASLPEKDANECLIKGKSKACHAACQFKAARPKNTRLVLGDELHESAKEPPQYGVSWPWRHITKATRGIRKGETIYIGAGQKQGKSEIVNTLAAHCMKEHGWKVFLIKPEESNKKTYKLIAGKLVGRIFHDPNIPFDEEAYEEAGKHLHGNLYMLNLYQHIGWETLKVDIRQAAAAGCEAIFIDPITNLTNGLDAASSNTKLQEIAQELSSMALDLDVVIFIFCHLRNPDSGLPHERGGEVLSSQFAGSRAMARSCNLMLGLEGNRDPNLSPEERNLRTLVLLEDREFGETGRYKLYWDRSTGLFNEV
jgi:twinkle protein